MKCITICQQLLHISLKKSNSTQFIITVSISLDRCLVSCSKNNHPANFSALLFIFLSACNNLTANSYCLLLCILSTGLPIHMGVYVGRGRKRPSVLYALQTVVNVKDQVGGGTSSVDADKTWHCRGLVQRANWQVRTTVIWNFISSACNVNTKHTDADDDDEWMNDWLIDRWVMIVNSNTHSWQTNLLAAAVSSSFELLRVAA